MHIWLGYIHTTKSDARRESEDIGDKYSSILLYSNKGSLLYIQVIYAECGKLYIAIGSYIIYYTQSGLIK